MRAALSIVVAAGCGSHPTKIANQVADRVPEARLVAISGRTTRFLTVANGKLVVEHSVELPSTAGTIAWLDKDPVVILAAPMYDESGAGDSKRDGEVGRITAHGFEPMQVPARAAWPAKAASTDPQFANDFSPLDPPHYKLVEDAAGVLWIGECGFWGGPDGGWCDQWYFARLAPPFAITKTEPTAARPRALPTIAPSASTKLALVKVPREERGPISILECRQDGKVTQYPAADARDGYFGIEEPTWITTDPTMYAAVRGDEGYMGISTLVVFEGCAPSATYEHAKLVGGPSDLIAIYTADKLSVRWRGHELGTLSGAQLVSFAP